MTAAAFQATFVKTIPVGGRKTVQFVFEVPVEKATEALTMLGGFPNAADSVWCAIARLTREAAEKPAQQSPQARVASPMTMRAGMLCNEPKFRKFLTEEYRHMIPKGNIVASEEDAAVLVRYICDVKSRKDIIPGTPAGDKWDKLYSKFIGWHEGLS